MQNKKNNAVRSIYNVSFGITSQIITIILGIIIPKLLIVNLGSESNGLLSSINQIYVYVSLLEAGVGAATLQALYEPVAKKDKIAINSVLSATKHYYDRVSLYYAIAVLGLSCIYPLTVRSSIDKVSIFLVILFTGISGIINFKYQAKFKILLQAEGKNYIVTNLTTITNIITSISRIILISNGYNIIAVQGVYCIISLVQMIYYTYYEHKYYTWLNYKEEPNFKAIKGKNSVLIHQISGLIFNNTDIILLTYFCSLTVVSVYALYNLIIGVLNSLINTCSTSVTFVLGQKYAKSKMEFQKLFNSYEAIIHIIVFAVYGTTALCILPFLRLYTIGFNDANYLDSNFIILFICVQVLRGLKIPGECANGVAGHFRETQKQAMLESAINLFTSIILVIVLNQYGVLIGTIIALLYRTNEIILYSHKHVIGLSSRRTYMKIIIDLVVTSTILFLFNRLRCFVWHSYWILLINAGIIFVVLLCSLTIINYFFDKTMLDFAKMIIKSRVERFRNKAN